MAEITDRLSTALADRYRLLRHLGEGGMATVYLAEDLKHDRQVAIKVLKPELAAVLGAERFVQEIKTTAALQHPHILPLFDSGEADSFLYYVMPYIEGETLRDKLNRETQLSIDEAVKIAAEIADALDYAHRHDVIHRDIKPENILLHDGRPVVADFGIALAVSAAAGGRMTETGLSLGTPHYMSPEQATAEKELTARSDVYSLGAVLYEMLTGDPPHTGSSAQQIIMRIVTDDARAVTDVRKAVPSNVAAAVATSLEKLPADRFTTAAALAEALRNPAFVGAGAAASSGGGPALRSDRWQGIALAMGLMVILLTGLLLTRDEDPVAPVVRWEVARYGAGVLRPIGSTTALAPDGSGMVFGDTAGISSGWQLWMRLRGDPYPTPLRGTEGGANVVYSPDGQHIAFASGSEIKRRPVVGGTTTTIARGARAGQVGLAWLSDGTILYEGFIAHSEGVTQSIVLRIPENGGNADTLAGVPSDRPNIAFIGGLPDSRGALLTVCLNGFCTAQHQMWVADFRTGEMRLLLDAVVRAWYAPSGHLVFVKRDGSVFGAGFDIDALELTSVPVPLFDGVAVQGTTPEMVVGTDGTAIYGVSRTGTVRSVEELEWTDRSGNAIPVDTTARADFFELALSPDGRQVTVVQRHQDGSRHVWIKSLDEGPLRRLTLEGPRNGRPNWSPDGSTVVFTSNRAGGRDIYAIPANGTQNARLLVDETYDLADPAISPDGRWLVYARHEDGNDWDIVVKRLDTDNDPVVIAATGGADEYQPAISPNGQWMAYVSTESGRQEIWVRPFPAGDEKWQVSNEGGDRPRWGADGRELLFRSGGLVDLPGGASVTPIGQTLVNASLAAVPVTPGATFTRGPVADLFSWTYQPEAGWDTDPANDRFLFVSRVTGTTSSAVFVVENFFEELKATVGN